MPGPERVFHTDDPVEGEEFTAARRMALPALEALGTVLLDDVAVPVPALPSMLECIREAADRHGVTIGTFGHAADGNLHPTIVFSTLPNRVRRIVRAELSTTSLPAHWRWAERSACEHGIGVLKAAVHGGHGRPDRTRNDACSQGRIRSEEHSQSRTRYLSGSFVPQSPEIALPDERVAARRFSSDDGPHEAV